MALTQTNGEKIISRLVNPANFDEALFEIYIARCMLNAGLKIHFLEEDNQNPMVDWKILDPDINEELLLELTELSNKTAEEREMLRLL